MVCFRCLTVSHSSFEQPVKQEPVKEAPVKQPTKQIAQEPVKTEQTKTVQQPTKQVVEVTNEKIEEERVVEHGTCSTCVKAKPDYSKAIAIAVKGELSLSNFTVY